MTKRKTTVAKPEPVVEETLEEPVVGPDEKAEEALDDLAEQDPDDIEITLKADPNALMLPECEQHRFVFLRTAKIRGNKSPEGMLHRRIDTFYCTHCLRYTTVAREEISKIQPEWFMGS